MAERFYLNCPLSLGPVSLQGAEAHHLAGVRRFRAGDKVCLFNGNGCEYTAEVRTIQRRAVTLDVGAVDEVDRELSFTLEVAAPLPKGDRAQFLVEKLTEIGVSRFVPLSTERSVISPREAKLEKLRRYVIEASKQCGRNMLMTVTDPVAWEDYCCGRAAGDVRYLAHPNPTENTATALGTAESVVLAVGPEGGFTDAEVALAKSEEWQVVTLGKRILRVETAAVVLAALVANRET